MIQRSETKNRMAICRVAQGCSEELLSSQTSMGDPVVGRCDFCSVSNSVVDGVTLASARKVGGRFCTRGCEAGFAQYQSPYPYKHGQGPSLGEQAGVGVASGEIVLAQVAPGGQLAKSEVVDVNPERMFPVKIRAVVWIPTLGLRKFARDMNGCENCREPGHSQEDCPQPKMCYVCGSKEHQQRQCTMKVPVRMASKNEAGGDASGENGGEASVKASDAWIGGRDAAEQSNVLDQESVTCEICFEPIEFPLRAGDVVTEKGPVHRECAREVMVEEEAPVGTMDDGDGGFFSAMEEEGVEYTGKAGKVQMIKVESEEMDPVRMLTNAIGRKKEQVATKVVPVGRWTMLFRFQMLNKLIERIECAGKEDESMSKVDKFLNGLVWSTFGDRFLNRLPDGWPPATCAPIRRIGTDMTMEEMAANRANGQTDDRSMMVARVKTMLFMMSWDATWSVLSFLLEPASLTGLHGFGTGWTSHAAAQTNNLEENDLQVVILPRNFGVNEERGGEGEGNDDMDTDEDNGGGEVVETPPKKKSKETR